MPKLELLSANLGDTLQELIEIVEANNKLLDWLLHNLDSENISELDTYITNVRGASLNIVDDTIILYGTRGAILAELSPIRRTLDSVTATGHWDFRGATVTGL